MAEDDASWGTVIGGLVLCGLFIGGAYSCGNAQNERQKGIESELKKVILKQKDPIIRGVVTEKKYVPVKYGISDYSKDEPAKFLVTVQSGANTYNLEITPTAELSLELMDTKVHKGDAVRFPGYRTVKDLGREYINRAESLKISPNTFIDSSRLTNNSGKLEANLLEK